MEVSCWRQITETDTPPVSYPVLLFLFFAGPDSPLRHSKGLSLFFSTLCIVEKKGGKDGLC